MRPVPEEWESLRLAAKAADREKAAETLRPAFEKRLTKLGYSPLAIAQAFSTLKGPGTVTQALSELEHGERVARSRAVPLEFETVEQEPALPAGHSLTITGVERDDYGIRIGYTIRPPLSPDVGSPRGEARDDRGREYTSLGDFAGITTPGDRATGGLTMPLPQSSASLLRVRISWSTDSASLFERPALELRITM